MLGIKRAFPFRVGITAGANVEFHESSSNQWSIHAMTTWDQFLKRIANSAGRPRDEHGPPRTYLTPLQVVCRTGTIRAGTTLNKSVGASLGIRMPVSHLLRNTPRYF